ncbi:sigma-70 family RNA polymerase sigma factor [Paraburkholderia sp. HD33-4]|uniref:sigma-70 family RNA polymerase sigma factor n=1 Tax=Paraburkholderia sp. HD33-4 TaxID=2883242 RepID=UPI001F2037F9|nr:sigma-70 family RNA polymerase sigma factor [Paraburkholderia sp. HD33-4]
MMDTSRNDRAEDAGLTADADADARRREHLTGLLLQTRDHDKAAFAELYRLTSSKLFGTCLRMLRDRGEAEDILQEVYVTVWQRANTFDPSRSSAMTWLVTLARNRTIDRLRQHRESLWDDDESEPEIADDTPSPAALAEQSQQRQRLERCLEQLGAPQREAVRAAFFSGATYSELAQRASVPLGTMKSWIRRSLIQLKGCLE